MANYNRIIMIGNLTRDPEYKQLTSGQSVCRLGLASNRQYRNKQTGNMVQEVCFVDIDVFGPQAESCNQYLQKGRSVLVEGRLKFDTWESPDGQARNKHSIVADRIVFLSSQSQTDGALAQNQDSETDSSGTKLTDVAHMGMSRNFNQAASESTAPKNIPDMGEVAFKDDLPF